MHVCLGLCMFVYVCIVVYACVYLRMVAHACVCLRAFVCFTCIGVCVCRVWLRMVAYV